MRKSTELKQYIFKSLIFLPLIIFTLGDISGQRLGQMSPETAMKKITDLFYQYASKEEIDRPVAYKTESWPSYVTRFIKMEKGEVPIMGSLGFESSARGTLEVAGVTKKGEILQFLEKKKIISIPNPLSRRPDTSGTWYKLRMLNGVEGWIFAKPDDSSQTFASHFEKKAVTQPKPAQQTKSSESKWFTDKDLRNLKTALIILAVLVLFIIIVSSASKRKSTESSSSGYSYSSSSEASSKSASMRAGTEEKDESKWPFREKDMIVGKKNIIEKHLILPDEKVGDVKKNWKGDTEIHKEKLFGTEKVGDVKRNFLGTAKSIETKDGGSFEIKETSWGKKIIVDEDGNEIGEYKGD